MKRLPPVAHVLTPQAVLELYDVEGELIAVGCRDVYRLNSSSLDEVKHEVAEELGIDPDFIIIVKGDSYAQD